MAAAGFLESDALLRIASFVVTLLALGLAEALWPRLVTSTGYFTPNPEYQNSSGRAVDSRGQHVLVDVCPEEWQEAHGPSGTVRGYPRAAAEEGWLSGAQL